MRVEKLTIIYFYIVGQGLAKTMCSKQEDCVAPGAERCSVCVDDPAGGGGECVFLFPKIYQPTPQCLLLDCTLCGRQGDCHSRVNDEPDRPGYHTYCWCKSPYSGADCSYLGEGNLLRYLRKDFKVVANLGEPTILTFHSLNERPVNKLDAAFYVNYDTQIYHEQPALNKEDVLDNSRTYDVITLFPYRSENNKDVYMFRAKPIGYTTNVSVTLIAHGKVLFKESYDIFVSYEKVDFSCFPKIEFMNCNEEVTNPVLFSRDSYIHIPFTVDYRANGSNETDKLPLNSCNPTEKTSWKVWNLYKNFVFQYPKLANYSYSRSIRITPFSLDIGSFFAKVEITVVRPEKSISSVSSCFFNIICKPLVAVISGGNDRMISSKVGLLLKAEKAYDPNIPLNDQTHVHLQWRCSNQSEVVCKPRHLKTHQLYFIPPNMLKPGTMYNFTMKVWTNHYDSILKCRSVKMSVSADVTIHVANESEASNDTFGIKCFLNCGTKVEPNRELFLKAITVFSEKTPATEYEWTYFEGSDGGESLDSIKVYGLPSYMLLLKENTLKVGTKYTILASLSNSSLYASYSFDTDQVILEGKSCTVNPFSGTKGLTIFQIGCKVTNLTGDVLSYEFYDKHDKEVMDGFVFSGRMLGHSNIGELKDVRLTRGNVIVYIFNTYGLYLRVHMKVDLRQWEIDSSILLGLYQTVTEKQRSGSFTSSSRFISFIPDIIPDSMDKAKITILNKLLGYLTVFPEENQFIGDLKIWTSTLNNILVTLNTPTQLRLEHELLLATIEVITRQAQLFSNIIFSGDMKNLPPKEVKQVSLTLLNSLHTGLMSRGKATDNIDEDNIDFMLLRQFKITSRNIECVLELITNILSYVQAPGQPATNVSSNDDSFVVWVMENDEHFGLQEILSREKDMKVELSAEAQTYLKCKCNKYDSLALQIVLIKDNIFWWSSSEVQSELVSVSIKRHYVDTFQPISYILKPMTVLVDVPKNYITAKLNGSAVKLDPANDRKSLDLGITVHRLDLAPGSIVSVRFLFPNTNASLRVYAADSFRPDYEMMTEKATHITETTPGYNVVSNHYDEPFFIFMGITPGQEVPVNQSVVYSFEINTTICQRWEYVQWSSTGCHAKKSKIQTRVQCDCTHFSIFAAVFPVPPNEINPYNDVTLFLTVIDNPLVVVMVVLILVLYILVSALLWVGDRKAQRKSNVILLADNFPSDKYPYLIAVYTSSRFNAGTTANVGITVLGTDSTSRCHILSCKGRKVLKSNSDDWFIIFTPQPLGVVTGMHVWHDNNGSSPKWYCNKIIVYDLLMKTETLFTINEWLAFQESQYPEVFVLPATEEDVDNIKSLFIENFVLGLMENHVFLSCFAGHPRSCVTRTQRLSIFVCCTMVAMFCSIMFYVPEDEQYNIDSYRFSVGLKEFIVSVQSVIISAMTMSLVVFAFRRSYKFTYVKEKSVLKFRRSLSSSTKNTKETFSNSQHSSFLQSLYLNFVKIVSKTLKLRPMKPVELLTCEPAMEVKRSWLIIAWITCISIIIICSYFVMLYGLKLGTVTSQEWLSSLTFTVAGEIVLYAPLRIIMASTLLTMAIQKMYDVNTHRVPISGLRLVKTTEDTDYITKLIIRRKHIMYRPLTSEQRNELLREARLRSKWWALVDFLVSAIFAVVVSKTTILIWSSYYFTNNHVIRLVTDYNNDLTFGQFFAVHDISSMENYLENTFVNVLYNVQWYQGSPLDLERVDNENKYWSTDCTHRMLGTPQIRQLRVVGRPCGTMINRTGNCIPSWTYSAEDRDVYSEHWGPATWYDASKADSPWMYTDETRKFTFVIGRLYGASGTHYVHGGYKVHLGPTRKHIELRLAELKRNHWLDVVTRVVFVEFTLYNVNQDMFVHVTLIVEFLASGASLPKAQATSVVTEVKFSRWSIACIAFLIFYLFRSLYLINHHGLLKFLSHFANVCRLVILVFGVLTVIIFTTHKVRLSQYLDSLQSRGLNDYFYFDKFVIFFVFSKLVMSLFICFVILHAILLLRAGRALLTHVHTFKLSLNWMFWSFVTTAIMLHVFLQFSIYFNIFMPYRTRYLIINKQSLNSVTVQDSEHLFIQVFIIIKTVSVGILVWLFLVQFKYYVKIAKSYNFKTSDCFNFVSFLVIQLNVKNK